MDNSGHEILNLCKSKQEFYAKLGESEVEKKSRFEAPSRLGESFREQQDTEVLNYAHTTPFTHLDCPGTPDADLCAGFLATRADTEVCIYGG